jgi:hypothetical protein
MATSAYEEAVQDIGNLDRSKAQEAQTILEFIKENISQWKGSNDEQQPFPGGAHHKKNMFSQQDSEA